MILGVTAVAIAAEELRSLALDFEKQASAAAVIDEALKHQQSEQTEITSTSESSGW